MYQFSIELAIAVLYVRCFSGNVLIQNCITDSLWLRRLEVACSLLGKEADREMIERLVQASTSVGIAKAQ